MTFRGVDQVEAEGADFVACCRVADLPAISSLPPAVQAFAREVRQRSTRQPCEGCGAQILVDSTSPRNPPKVCLQCMADIRRMANKAAGKPS